MASTAIPEVIRAPGLKRKQTLKSSITPSAWNTGVQWTLTQLSKKRRLNKDEYNIKYMAAMCLHAYNTRRHKTNVIPRANAKYQSHLSMEVLVRGLQALQSRSITKYFEDACRIVSVLVRPHDVSAHVSNAAPLTIRFINEYDHVRCTLLKVDTLMENNHPVGNLHLNTLRNTVRDLHDFLGSSSLWYDILPYTSLSLRGLRVLQDRIWRLDTYRHLSEISPSIRDIERWLKIPHPLCQSFEDLKQVARVAMEEIENEKLTPSQDRPKILAHREVESSAENKTSEQLREQSMVKQNKVVKNKIKEDEIEKDVTKEQLQEQSLCKEEAHRAELQNWQENVARELRRVDTEAMVAEHKKRAAEKGQEEEAERDQKNAADKVNVAQRQPVAGLARYRQERKVQNQKQQQEQARESREDPHAKKQEDNERKRLYLQRLIEYVHSINTGSHGTFVPPDPSSSYTTLHDLRARQNVFCESTLPQRLLADFGYLLTFESDVLDELTAIVRLKYLGHTPSYIYTQTWSLLNVQHLRDNLRPYADRAPFTDTDLIIGVDHICRALELIESQIDAQKPVNFASSTSTQSSHSSFLGPWSSGYGSITIENTVTNKPQQHDVPLQASTCSTLKPFSNSTRVEIKKIRRRMPISSPDGDYQGVCPDYKRGNCEGRGCELPHTACAFFLKGRCHYSDDTCRGSHDLWFHEEARSKHEQQQRSTHLHERQPFESNSKNRYTANQFDWRANKPCNPNFCRRKKGLHCSFKHDGDAGSFDASLLITTN